MKFLLKKILSLFGLFATKTVRGWFIQKRRFKPQDFKWLQEMHIKIVLDVGAFEGQFSLLSHKLFPNALIYAFEPLKDCFSTLNRNMGDTPGFKAYHMALSDSKGKQEFHRSEFAPSSSLRKMSNLHKEAYPHTAGETTETVDTETLDNFAKAHQLKGNILMKIDVQGCEDQVLQGGLETLKNIKVIILETSFHQLYEDQPLFKDIYHFLTDQGFIYSGSWGQWKKPKDGSILQQDSIFVRQ